MSISLMFIIFLNFLVLISGFLRESICDIKYTSDKEGKPWLIFFLFISIFLMLYAKIGWYGDVLTYYISMAILTGEICVKTFVDMEKLNDSGD